MFLRLLFLMSSGVLSIHRKSNLPAEESRIKAFKRIGNETHGGGHDEAFTAGVMTEGRVGQLAGPKQFRYQCCSPSIRVQTCDGYVVSVCALFIDLLIDPGKPNLNSSRGWALIAEMRLYRECLLGIED